MSLNCVHATTLMDVNDCKTMHFQQRIYCRHCTHKKNPKMLYFKSITSFSLHIFFFVSSFSIHFHMWRFFQCILSFFFKPLYMLKWIFMYGYLAGLENQTKPNHYFIQGELSICLTWRQYSYSFSRKFITLHLAESLASSSLTTFFCKRNSSYDGAFIHCKTMIEWETAFQNTDNFLRNFFV